MGKFTNSKYTQTIESLVQATNSKINNPYYKFNDKKPTEVTYYKQNIEKSTLDPATGTNYQHVGDYSPIKFNKISGFFLYGLGRIELNYDVGDFGLESGEIAGDAIILPNTIKPTPGDFFSVPYIKEDVLFKVNSVTIDTLDNGSNFYKIEYKLELVNDTDKITKQVVENFNFVVSNIGTDFNAVITSDNYTLTTRLEELLETLNNLYQLFFDKGVQSFIYEYNGCKMYDPYMIEFLIRTKILSYSDTYFYVHHATTVSRMFDYDYTKTFFYALEKGELNEGKVLNYAAAIKIEDINSLFVTRLEDYYKIDYCPPYQYITKFNIISEYVLKAIKEDSKYCTNIENSIYNIWIDYFNGNLSITDDMINTILEYPYKNDKESFYIIPITMYIIARYIEKVLMK